MAGNCLTLMCRQITLATHRDLHPAIYAREVNWSRQHGNQRMLAQQRCLPNSHHSQSHIILSGSWSGPLKIAANPSRPIGSMKWLMLERSHTGSTMVRKQTQC